MATSKALITIHYHHHMVGSTGAVFVPLLIAQLLLLVTFAIILLGLYYFCCSITSPQSPSYRTVQFPVLFSNMVSHGLFYVFGEIVLYVVASIQSPRGQIPQWVALSAVSGSLVVEPVIFANVCSEDSSHVWNAIATACFSAIMGLGIVLHHAMAWPRYFLLSIYSGSLCMTIAASLVVHTISTHKISRSGHTVFPRVLQDGKHEPTSRQSITWLALAALTFLWGVQSIPNFVELDSALQQAIDLYMLLLVILTAITVVVGEVTLLGWRVHPVIFMAINALIHESMLCYTNNVPLVPAASRIVRSCTLDGALGFIGSAMIIYYGKRSILPNCIESYDR